VATVSCLQYTIIFMSWVEILSIFKNLNIIEHRIEFIKKLINIVFILLLIYLVLFYSISSTNLRYIAIGELVYFVIVSLAVSSILCGLAINGTKLARGLNKLKVSDSTTRTVTYNTIGLVIYFTIELALAIPALFLNTTTNYLADVAFVIFYIFNLVIVIVYTKL